MILLSIVDRQSLFKVRPRADVIALELTRYAMDVQCAASP